MRTWLFHCVVVTSGWLLVAACGPRVLFHQTGASRPPLAPEIEVLLYPDGPPLPPFAELGLLNVRCRDLADDEHAEQCLRQAEREARARGGNGLVLLPAREPGRHEGVIRLLVIERDPRLR